MTRPLRVARGLLVALVGLALLLAAAVAGVVPALAHGLEAPRTVAAYTYGGAAPVARGTTTNPGPPTEFIAPVRLGSLTPEEVSARSAEFGVAAESGDSALVVRGGTNTADRFSGGSGVTMDEAGNVHGVSVNSAPGRSLEDLTQGIRNKQVGVTTVGDIKAAGGYVKLDPTPGNPSHCLVGGCSPEQFEAPQV